MCPLPPRGKGSALQGGELSQSGWAAIGGALRRRGSWWSPGPQGWWGPSGRRSCRTPRLDEDDVMFSPGWPRARSRRCEAASRRRLVGEHEALGQGPREAVATAGARPGRLHHVHVEVSYMSTEQPTLPRPGAFPKAKASICSPPGGGSPRDGSQGSRGRAVLKDGPSRTSSFSWTLISGLFPPDLRASLATHRGWGWSLGGGRKVHGAAHSAARTSPHRPVLSSMTWHLACPRPAHALLGKGKRVMAAAGHALPLSRGCPRWCANAPHRAEGTSTVGRPRAVGLVAHLPLHRLYFLSSTSCARELASQEQVFEDMAVAAPAR